MAEASILSHAKFNFGNEDPVSCMMCDIKFTVSDDIQLFLSHLLDSHNFLIEAPMEILDLREYIIYWKKLSFGNLQDYCILYTTNTEPEAQSSQETYYLLSNKLTEDKEIRSTIMEEKLKYISNQMSIEWQDKSFSRKCVYCSNIIEGGLHKVFNHLKYDHNISLGNNIVFGAKLLDVIEDKLQNLLCLYCENQFKNHISLREHMRKKCHKSLNPKNKSYDKFYLVNYVKPGTSWEAAKQELREEFDEDDDDILEWGDWHNEQTNETIAKCLFCPFSTSKITSDLYSHMVSRHRYNFEEETEHMSFYEKVKLINYIRTKISCHTCITCLCVLSSNDQLLHHMTHNNHFAIKHRLWNERIYFIPFIKNDGLLHNIKDDEIVDENSSGYASSNHEEMVFPEVIPRNFEIAESSSDDVSVASLEEGIETEYKCLFCTYITYGMEAKQICKNHMQCNHVFSYKKSIAILPSNEGMKLVNYIRFMTAAHKCFSCRKMLNSETGLVVHLQLCNHTEDSDNYEYLEDRWKTPFLSGDTFVLDLERRIYKNILSNEV